MKKTNFGIEDLRSNSMPSLFSYALVFCRILLAWGLVQYGLDKIIDWDNGLFLFEYKNHIPFIPSQFIAYMAAAATMILPIFIALGFLTRIAIILLLAFISFALLSAPTLWNNLFYFHYIWGVLLIVILFTGPGRISLDNKLASRQKRMF